MPRLDSSKADYLHRLSEIEAKFQTRKDAAKAAGIAQSTFQNWATGKVVPNFQGMANLAKAAGVSLDRLEVKPRTAAWPPAPPTEVLVKPTRKVARPI